MPKKREDNISETNLNSFSDYNNSYIYYKCSLFK